VAYEKVQLRSISLNRSEEVGFLRFLNNDRIEEHSLIDSISNRVNEMVEDKHVLCVEDTSELHYHHHKGRIKDGRGLGDVGRSPLGYFIHPSIVLGTSGDFYGLSDMKIWNRDIHRTTHATTRKQRPIEEKETYKWISSSIDSKARLTKAKRVTIIQDRDGDIYETFARIPDERTELLIRSKTDRKTLESPHSLYKCLAINAPCAHYELKVSGEGKKRQKRKALMQVRFQKAKILRPASVSKAYPVHIELTIVEAKEQAFSVPAGEQPICWKLLTTHQVEDFTDAVQIVYWYTLRWLIEEFFRLLKSKGFNLESSELESGKGLRKLGIMTMQAASRIMQLRQAREETCRLPIEVIFDENEQKCLEDILIRVNGNTEKLQNPHPRESLKWASWIIARLGGWSGYKSQRPAGVITLKRGLERFEVMYLGWSIAQKNDTS